MKRAGISLVVFLAMSGMPLTIFGEPAASSAIAHDDELSKFEVWALLHGIELVGTNKGTNYLYYNGFDPQTDSIDWRDVPRVLIAANALYTIPENIIEVMRGKTIYFSNQPGRSYTVLSSFPDYNILEGMNRGIILEQGINAHTTIHEVGHVVDYHSIQGIYVDKQNIFSESKNDRIRIFAVNGTFDYATGATPAGYITAYSTSNDAENFAENFAYFITRPDEYKFRVESDPLLADEYEFLVRILSAE